MHRKQKKYAIFVHRNYFCLMILSFSSRYEFSQGVENTKKINPSHGGLHKKVLSTNEAKYKTKRSQPVQDQKSMEKTQRNTGRVKVLFIFQWYSTMKNYHEQNIEYKVNFSNTTMEVPWPGFHFLQIQQAQYKFNTPKYLQIKRKRFEFLSVQGELTVF